MNTPTADDVQRALRALAEGLPGHNDPYQTGTGELDNADVRHLLAGAAFTAVLRSDSSKTYDDLAHHFDEPELIGWFGSKRAELILEMLHYLRHRHVGVQREAIDLGATSPAARGVQEGDRRCPRVFDSQLARLAPLPGEDLAQQDAQDSRAQRRVASDGQAQREGQREHPLPVARHGEIGTWPDRKEVSCHRMVCVMVTTWLTLTAR